MMMHNISPIIQETQEKWLSYYRENNGTLEQCIFTFSDEVYQALVLWILPQQPFEKLILDVTKYKNYVDSARRAQNEVQVYDWMTYQLFAIHNLIANSTTNPSVKAELQLTYGTEFYKCLNDDNIRDMVDTYLTWLLNSHSSRRTANKELLDIFLHSLKTDNNVWSLEYEVIAPAYFWLFPQDAFIMDTDNIDIQVIKHHMMKRNELLAQRDVNNVDLYNLIKRYEFHLWLMTHSQYFTYDINKAISNDKDHPLFYIKQDRAKQWNKWQID